jgi:hypothetical protein
MQRFTLRAFIFPFCLISLCAFAQENRVIRVGVPTMKNQAGRSVPGNMERDRLVAALNHQKPDKKQHLAVQGVPLEGAKADEVGAEAKEKQCDYVVYTSLIELRTSTDAVQRTTPGTIQTNPGGLWNNPNNPRAQALGPEYSATVEYKLYRTGDVEAISAAPFTDQQAMPEEAVVSQVMDRIATRVFAEIKKGPPAMREQACEKGFFCDCATLVALQCFCS